MVKRIRILFVAEDKDYQIQCAEPLDYEKFMQIVSRQQQKLQDPLKTRLKAFVRNEVEQQKHVKYIKMSKEGEIADYLSSRQLEVVTIEFFHGKKEQTIRRSIIKIAEMLDKRERQLRNLTNQLKDEVNQLNALRFIRKSTSPDEEQTIDVFLVVCDPLVEQEKDQDNSSLLYPLFHDEVDLPSHIQRLRKASLSNGDFRIRPQRVWGTKKQLYQTLLHGTEGDRQRRVFSIVQIFTRVERRNGVLMLSLQGQGEQLGMRVWQEAANLFKRQINANIVIIIGIGVNQLSQLAKQLNFNKPLILISTISVEDKRIITTTCDRSLIDIENTYNDRYCQVFLQSFYSNLFRRNDVRKCYQMAMKDLSEPSIKQNLWCCCLHAHHPECNWYKIVRRIGELEAHRLLKHQIYLKATFNLDRKKLQTLLLNDQQLATCTDEKICCWEKISGKSNKSFHETLDKCIIWNQRQPDEVYSHLEPEQEMPNRFFQSKTYDKPTGRKRPLTIYKVLHHLLKNDICILRAPIISQAKRYFSFAREYLQARHPCLSYHEFEASYNRETNSFKKKAEELILQRKAPIGASIKSRRMEWIFLMQYSHDKNDSYYKTILKDLVDLSSYYSREAKLKLVLLTDDANFLAIKILNMLTKAANKNQKIVGNLKIDDPLDIEDMNSFEKYHNILSKHSSDYVIQKMQSIKEIMQAEHQIDQEKEENQLEVLRQQNKDIYLFLGFLSQFSEDGFYLNNVSHIILKQLFGQQLLQKVLNNELPVQHINLADCTYLQLHKAYHNHFKNPQNLQRLYFQQKKLQFYYLLMRLYFQYWPKANVINYPGVIRQFINKQGIFSIDIQLEWSDYEEDVQACIREIEPTQNQIKTVLFDITNPIHVYHLAQVQKILQQVLKKKRNRHNPTTSRSFIDEKQFKIFQYLLWNIIQKSWLMSQVLYEHYEESIRRFEMVLLIFFVQAEILLPISQVARIQIHVLMNRSPPKLQDNQFGNMTAFLRFYRNYAFKSMALDNLEPGWGNHHKCKEIIQSCFFLAGKISEIFDDSSNCPRLSAKAKEDHDRFKEYIKLKHKMFTNTNSQKWLRQCLKKIEKKVLYYFSFTNKMKNTQNYQEYNQKMAAFEKQFKLGQIKYELDGYKSKLPIQMLQEKETILIEHYLRVNLQEKEVDKQKLADCKGKVSADYLPIFSYLCQKVQQKALFNQTGLVIFARARNLTYNGKPYFYTRKRTLLSHYLGKVFQDKELKICYFPLTEKMFNLFEINENKNSKCEVLCMILTVDSCSGQQLLFGQELGVDTVRMPIIKFIEKIRSCRIKILILCGKDSTRACRRIKQLLSNQHASGLDPSMTHSVAHSLTRNMGTSAIRLGPMSTSTIRLPSTSSQSAIKSSSSNIKQSGSSNASKIKASGTSNSGLKTKNYFPTIIAIQSTRFSLCDHEINTYKPQNQAHEVAYSQIKENRPSLFSNPRMSIAKDKEEVIKQEKGDSEQLEQLPRQSKIKHKISQQTPGYEEDIDKIILQGVQHEFKLQVNDDSGRNRFSAILEQARSEGTSEPYQEESLDLHTQVETYIANEINSIAMELIIISIAKRIADRASYRDRVFTEQMIKEIIDKSKEDVHHILKSRFQCADIVFRNIIYQIWVNNQAISKVDKGHYQDLTKKFYCADNNLRDEIYYQNIGHCEELKQVFETLVEKKINCIAIVGGLQGQKSNFLQEICWTAQIKSLFKFGTFKIDFNDGNLNSLLARTFKDRDNRNNETGILIAFDKIDKNLQKFKKDLQKLKGKSFTVIFTAGKREIAKEMQQILGFSECHWIDFEKRAKQEIDNYVYANLLSQVKEKPEFKFTSQILTCYQTKIDEIMKAVQKIQTQDKLMKAIELLRGSNCRSEDEKMQIYYNFYKQNFEQLVNSLQQIKEITLKVL